MATVSCMGGSSVVPSSVIVNVDFHLTVALRTLLESPLTLVVFTSAKKNEMVAIYMVKLINADRNSE